MSDLDTQTNALQVSVYLCTMFYDTSLYYGNVNNLKNTIQGTLVCVTWQCNLICSVQCTCIELTATGSLPHIRK